MGSTVADLQSDFERATVAVRALGQRPDNDTLLRLYGLYKQGTTGDADENERPGFFDFVGTAKLEAWRALHGMSQEQARRDYIELARTLGATV